MLLRISYLWIKNSSKRRPLVNELKVLQELARNSDNPYTLMEDHEEDRDATLPHCWVRAYYSIALKDLDPYMLLYQSKILKNSKMHH